MGWANGYVDFLGLVVTFQLQSDIFINFFN